MSMKSIAVVALVMGAFIAGSVQASVSAIAPTTTAGAPAARDGHQKHQKHNPGKRERAEGHQKHQKHRPAGGPK